MDLSIVIVNYKSREKLERCLASLRLSEPGVAREIFIVENASGDNLADIATRYPEAELIISPRNLGMGGGNNLGIDKARGEFVLILNPDTVLSPDVIRLLMDYLKQHPEVGMVGPKLLNPDGSLQYSCSRWPGFFLPFLRRTFLGRYFPAALESFMMQDFDHATDRLVDWLMGSCLMFRREMKKPEGRIFRPRFDERYFMYFEDTDLARQVWHNGYQVAYVPAAVVIHDHQRASAQHPWYLALFLDRIAWRHIDSWLKYFAKWGLKKIKTI